MDHRELKARIQAFSLADSERGDQGYKRVLLQMFGYMGHGKSSFINSCKYVLMDGEDFIEHARTRKQLESQGRESFGSLTTVRNVHNLTSNITIVDNRGNQFMTDFEQVAVYSQLGNFHPLNQDVEWKKGFKEVMSTLEDNEMNPNTTDFLVPMFIFSAKTKFSEQEENAVKTFLQNCVKMTGIFPIIIITHKASGDYREAERKFQDMGAERVFPIENYTVSSHIKTLGKTTDILKILDCALQDVRYRMEQLRDPTRERKERRKFLLNYMHEAKMKEKRAQEEKERIKREEEEKKLWFFQRWWRKVSGHSKSS